MLSKHLHAVLPTWVAAVAVCAAGLSYTAMTTSATGPDRLVSSVGTAPLRGADDPDAIDDHYIVVLKAPVSSSDAVLDAAVDRAGAVGADVTRTYGEAINGYAATMSDGALAAARSDPAVAYVEADRRISIDASRGAASWGQDRIDARAGLDTVINTVGDGSGVTAYVIDTGVRASRLDLAGRVAAGFSAIADGNGTNDCNGHGTHVAGTIGSATYGIAPGVTIVPVRVLACDGTGTSSGVIAGVDWVTAHHGADSVANMSLGGDSSTSLDYSVSNSIASGVTFAVAAGNSGTDACLDSPGRVPAAITVAASTRSDTAASFSNGGSCVDLYAPGENIVSDSATADVGSVTMSGTSMATPHVSGAAALYLQANPGASPAAVAAGLTADATANVLTGVPSGTPNRLLHVTPPTPAPSVPPVAAPVPASIVPVPLPLPSASAPVGVTAPPVQPTAVPTASPTGVPPSAPIFTPPSTPTRSAAPTPTGTSPSSPTTPVPTVPPCSVPKAADAREVRAATSQVAGKAYTTTRTGWHYGCLTVPAKADFDLELWKWNGQKWIRAAAARTTASRESVVHKGVAGRYRWQVARVSGYGSYTLRSGFIPTAD